MPSRRAVELARSDDEPELRRLLRENPMAGEIGLALEREPDYFRAAAIEGPRHLTFVARDWNSGSLAGMGSRSVRECFVDGQKRLLPYLGALRVCAAWRGGRRYLAAAFDLCRDQRRPDEEPYCLTSIVADNLAARRFLGAGLPGFPRYHELETFVTLVLPAGGRMSRRPARRVRRSEATDLQEIVRLLESFGMRHQFHPVWSVKDLLSNERTPGLAPNDFFVVDGPRGLVGCLALWDQRSFKQAVVRRYSRRLERWRPLVNLTAPILGLPRLPRVGERVNHAYLSHIAVESDEPAVLIDLVAAARRAVRHRGIAGVLLGLAGRHPMLPELRRAFRHRAYPSVLYLVRWPGRDGSLPEVDGRVPHVEIAAL